MPITMLYAGILGLILIALAFRVIILVRAKAGISFGDGGDANLTPIVRGHGNFIEYVPIALILMGLLESHGASAGFLHGLGIALVASRLIHPFGLHPARGIVPARLVGAAATFLVIAVASVAALWRALV